MCTRTKLYNLMETLKNPRWEELLQIVNMFYDTIWTLL